MHSKMPKAYLLHTSNIFNYLALPLACTTNKQNLDPTHKDTGRA